MIWLVLPMGAFLGFSTVSLCTGHPALAAVSFAVAALLTPAIKVERK